MHVYTYIWVYLFMSLYIQRKVNIMDNYILYILYTIYIYIYIYIYIMYIVQCTHAVSQDITDPVH